MKISALTVLLTVALVSMSAQAGLLAYLDAADPGATPSVSCQDLAGLNQDFAVVDTVVYDAGTQSYMFGGGYLLGAQADESRFDFDTEKAGVGMGTRFAVVGYYKLYDGDEAGGNAFLAKMAAVNNGQLGWSATPGHHPSLGFRLDGNLEQGVMNGGKRVYERYDATQSDAFANPEWDWHMFVMTVDGSGSSQGLKFYVDGSAALAYPPSQAGEYLQDNLDATILNDIPLTIGRRDDVPSGLWVGDMGFVEVWAGNRLPMGMTADEFSAWRWNGGQPLRGADYMNAIPEPITLSILGLGGLAMLRRRRS